MEYPKLAQKEQAKKYHFYPTVVFHYEALRQLALTLVTDTSN